MKFTHLAFAIAALGGAVAISVAAPAHADIKWNGPVLQGARLNGPVLQGLELNGMRMNGAAAVGAKAGVDSCQPKANQICEPRVRAVVLPSGQRMGLK